MVVHRLEGLVSPVRPSSWHLGGWPGTGGRQGVGQGAGAVAGGSADLHRTLAEPAQPVARAAAAAAARGIVCCGTRSAGSPTPELTWGLLLGFLRHIPLEDRATRLGAPVVGVNARDLALRKDLGKYQGYISGLELTDYRVRILNGGTEAVTRVLIESEAETGGHSNTVGVSSYMTGAPFPAPMGSIVSQRATSRAPA